MVDLNSGGVWGLSNEHGLKFCRTNSLGIDSKMDKFCYLRLLIEEL